MVGYARGTSAVIRKLLNVTAAVSFALFVSLLALWVRSYHHAEVAQVRWGSIRGSTYTVWDFSIVTGRGGLGVGHSSRRHTNFDAADLRAAQLRPPPGWRFSVGKAGSPDLYLGRRVSQRTALERAGFILVTIRTGAPPTSATDPVFVADRSLLAAPFWLLAGLSLLFPAATLWRMVLCRRRNLHG